MTEEQKAKIASSKRGKMLGSDNPSWKGGKVFVLCAECSCSIHRHPSLLSRNNFCSKSCESVHKTNNEDYGSWNKGLTRSESTREKIRIANTGRFLKEKSPHWIKDRSLVKQDEKKHLDRRYREWASNIKNRDGWKCRINNDECCGKLEAHHILRWSLYPELRYEINNGITLCHFHHPRKLSDETVLASKFISLIEISK